MSGIQQVAQADETKAAVEDMKGKANANKEKAKGEAKALTEEAKANDVKAQTEGAEGTNQSSRRANERRSERIEI